MLELPLAQTFNQAKLGSESCKLCKDFTSVAPIEAFPDEQNDTGLFAGLIDVLLNADASLQSITGNLQATSLLTEGRAELSSTGNTLPHAQLQSGKVLPLNLLPSSLTAQMAGQPETLELTELNAPLTEPTLEFSEEIEFMQALLPRGGFQQNQLHTAFKSDHLSSLSHSIELQGNQFNNNSGYIDTFGNVMQTKDTPMLLDTQKSGWEKILGERVMFVVNQGVQGARLQLNPPELGPLKIDLTMDGDQVNVNFITLNAQAKDAIDLSMPKLREMFQGTGVELADAHVFDHKAHQEFQRQASESSHSVHDWEQDNLDGIDDKNKHQKIEIYSNNFALIDAYV